MKKISILFAILALIALTGAGCQSSSNNGGVDVSTPFIGGTNGILVSFSDEMPAEVIDGGTYPFDVSVVLKNDGETTVKKEDMNVTITGVFPQDFDKTQKSMNKTPEDDMVAKRKDGTTIIESTPVYVYFPNFVYKPILPGSNIVTFQANVCYNYGTTVNAKYCVRKDLIGPAAGGLCDLSGDKQVFNSGAPVQVANFKQNSAGSDKIHFTFDVQKAGNSNIYKWDSKCVDAINNKNLNLVRVNITTGLPAPNELKCMGMTEMITKDNTVVGYVKLINGQTTVTCNQKITEPADYEKIANIILTYDVKETISRAVTIKHIG